MGVAVRVYNTQYITIFGKKKLPRHQCHVVNGTEAKSEKVTK